MSPSHLLTRFKTLLETHCLISKNDSVLVAVSGGPDSIGLLHLLVSLREEMGFSVSAGHLDHGTREGESTRDAEFVGQICRKWKVELHSEKWSCPPGAHFHQAAREARYRFLLETAISGEMNKVATGHHLDDQAETVLIRLLRGTGRGGLEGIRQSQILQDDPRAILLIRPLLEFLKEDIVSYLHGNHIPFVGDGSNQDPKYLRNKVRNELVPFLESELNPNVKEALNRFTRTIQVEEDFLEEEAVAAQSRIVSKTPELTLKRSGFRHLHEAIRRRLVRRVMRNLLNSLNLQRERDLEGDQIRQIEDLILTGNAGKKYSVAGGIELRIKEDVAVFALPEPDVVPLVEKWKLSPGGKVTIPQLGINVQCEEVVVENWNEEIQKCTPYRQIFDFGDQTAALALRTWKVGDRFRPLGLGGEKKVKDLFAENRIPVRERQQWPILEVEDQVAWVVGLQMDERFRLTPKRKRGHWVTVCRITEEDGGSI